MSIGKSAQYIAFALFITLLTSFTGVIYFDLIAIDGSYFSGVKLIAAVVCMAAVLYWNFVRQSNNEEHQYGEFRRWQVASIFGLHAFANLIYLVASDSLPMYWVSALTLFVSGGIFFSLYQDFITKRLADFLLMSGIVAIFYLLISYSLYGNLNITPLTTGHVAAKIFAFIGTVLLLATSILWIQPKLSTFSELELLPVLILVMGYFELMGRELHWLWWMSAAVQLLFVITTIILIVKVNQHASMDWGMLAAGLDNARHAYFCSDMDGNIHFVNKAYKSLFDISSEHPIYKIKYPFYAHPLLDSISAELQKKQSWEGETVLINKDGKVTSVYAHVIVSDFHGKKVQQGWFEDIHEKKAFRAKENEISQKLEQLSLNLLEKQEEERSYFAKELHDEIGQGLTLLKIQMQLPEPDNKLILSVLSEMIDKVRNLSLNLRPAILDDMGLSAALGWLVDRQKQFSKLNISSAVSADIPRLNDKLEISVFRIAQEAFTNIHKYSHATHVNVRCEIENDYLVFSIADDGIGFDIDTKISRANKGQSLGLLSIKERAYLINGVVDIQSSPEQGTQISLKAPIEQLRRENSELNS